MSGETTVELWTLNYIWVLRKYKFANCWWMMLLHALVGILKSSDERLDKNLFFSQFK